MIENKVELEDKELRKVTGGNNDTNSFSFRVTINEKIKINDTQYCKLINQGGEFLYTNDPNKSIRVSVNSIATGKAVMTTNKTAKYLKDCRDTYGNIV